MTATEAPTKSVQDLCLDNLDMARYEALDQYNRTPPHVTLDDLVSVANEALVVAAHRYDPSRATTFRAYAKIRVRGALLDEMRRQDWASRPARRELNRRDATIAALTGDLGREPTPDELAAALGITRAKLAKIDHDGYRSAVLSLDRHQELCGPDVLPDSHESSEGVIIGRELYSYLKDGLDLLSWRHRYVLDGYYLSGIPGQQMADELGVSSGRITQLRKEALAIVQDVIAYHLRATAPPPPRQHTGRTATRRANAYRKSVFDRTPWRKRISSVT